ncbi:unnamed protein product [Lupinus luteus]|uniref:Uncharacterized protein n=1 Tax=Lupinus luteus TaxID=3873 RepID=A0AAV1WP24_LUPLU
MLARLGVNNTLNNNIASREGITQWMWMKWRRMSENESGDGNAEDELEKYKDMGDLVGKQGFVLEKEGVCVKGGGGDEEDGHDGREIESVEGWYQARGQTHRKMNTLGVGIMFGPLPLLYVYVEEVCFWRSIWI